MSETIVCNRRFEDLHARNKLTDLTRLLLGYPRNIDAHESTRVMSMFNHPARRSPIHIEFLGVTSTEDSVALKYIKNTQDEQYKHKFQVTDEGQQTYSRSIVDCHGRHIKNVIDLKSGLEIVNNAEAVRQLSLVTPLIMAAVMINLGAVYVNASGIAQR